MSEFDVLMARTTRCGMTDGTVAVIEYISGCELFGAYETWRQGWRVHGLGVLTEGQELVPTLKRWVDLVNRRREGGEIPPHTQLDKYGRSGGPYRAAEVLPDWVTPTQPVQK